MKRYLLIGFITGFVLLNSLVNFLKFSLLKSFDAWSPITFFITYFAPVIIAIAVPVFVIFRRPTRKMAACFLGVLFGFIVGDLYSLFAYPPIVDGGVMSIVFVYGPIALTSVVSIVCCWRFLIDYSNP